MKKILRNKKIKAFLVVFAVSVIFGTVFGASESFSELYTLKVAPFFRIPLSFATSFFPFSLGESFVLILLLFALLTLLSGIRMLVMRIFKKVCKSYFKVYLKIVLYSLAFIYFTYAFTFQSSYSRVPISKSLEIEAVEMNAENVSLALSKITSELNDIASQLEYTRENGTVCELDFSQMAKEVLGAAKKASEKYPIYQKHPFKAKPIAFSEPLAYTGISGIYSFFTGESNINTSFWSYSVPFTIAHEYSHQMGIGSEKEAEFSALLICLESEHPYVKYSAYSQAAITLSNILFELDEEAFYNAFSALPSCLVNDIYLSSKSSQKYSQTIADEVAEAINDTYLSLSGDEGVVSYSLSSQLYTAYFLKK